MSNPIHRRRTVLARLLAGFIFLGSLFLFAVFLGGSLPAQQAAGKKARVVEEEDDKQPKKKAPVEEEEDKGPKQKRKVIRVDDEDGPMASPKPARGDAFTGDLAALMKDTKHPGIRAMCANLIKPHDIIGAEYTNRKEKMTVEPLAKYYGPEPKLQRELSVVPLSQEWEPGKLVKLASTVVKKHTPYEEAAQAEADAFLTKERWDEYPKDSKSYLSKRDALAAASYVLAQVYTWHSAAQLKEIRQGDEWEAVQTALQKKLLEFRERQLDETLLENDWDAASELARDIGRRYPEKVVQERVAKRLAKYIAEELPKGGLTAERLKEVRDRLRQLEAQFPGSSAAETIGKELKEQAERLFREGKKLISDKQNQQGIDLLQQAMDLYPQLPDLQTTFLRETHAYPVLRVGVKDLPIYMAPRVACTESERQAVEMIFEGLVKQVPEYFGDDVGERYEPALAERMPQQTAQLVRKFYLSRGAVWAMRADERRPLTANDVRGTWQLLKDPGKPDFAPAWAELIDNVRIGNDEREVSIALKHGFIDPYSAMTFKVLPDEASGKDYKEGFARRPFGSGPYRFDEVRTIDNEPRMVFMANRFYSARPSKHTLPRIREVYLSKPQDPISDFSKGRLDLLLPEAVRDLGPGKLDELRKVAKVVGPLPTRRIYFLAVNLRKPVFESEELRRALAYAIPRAEILQNVFGGLPGDKALTGPYPAGSWACDSKIRSLDNPPLAKQTIEMGGARAKLAKPPRLTLKYPQDDKAAEAAMRVIAARLDETLGVKIDLEPLDPHELREKVENFHAYDLAYYHYDFPSEAYWLWPLFHPNGTYFGSGLAEDGFLSSLFRQAMARRDPAELQKLTHDIHNHINTKMYILPLWQLGSYYAIRDAFETPPIDPLRVLADVGEWRPKRSR